MSSLKYILFDAGGTLLGTNTDVEHWYEQFFVDACAAEGHPVTLEHVRESLHRATAAYKSDRWCSSPDTVRSFWQLVYGSVFRDLVPGCDPEYLATHYIDRFESGEFIRLFDDTLPALEAVRAMGVKAGIVSNFGTYLEVFLDKTGIASFFDVVLISAAEGCEKPHPEIFDRALECVGLPASEIMFIGDSLRDDYEASVRHGFFGVLLDRYDRYAHMADVRRVRSLTEIPKFLNGYLG